MHGCGSRCRRQENEVGLRAGRAAERSWMSQNKQRQLVYVCQCRCAGSVPATEHRGGGSVAAAGRPLAGQGAERAGKHGCRRARRSPSGQQHGVCRVQRADLARHPAGLAHILGAALDDVAGGVAQAVQRLRSGRYSADDQRGYGDEVPVRGRACVVTMAPSIPAGPRRQGPMPAALPRWSPPWCVSRRRAPPAAPLCRWEHAPAPEAGRWGG